MPQQPVLTPLHCCLQQATAAAHRRLERHPLLTKLLSPELSRADYGDTLAALYGMQAPAEAAVRHFLLQQPALFDYSHRYKLPTLDADLHALGRAPLPLHADCPAPSSAGALFGMLYVLEGATLGGSVIAHRIRRNTAASLLLPLQFYTVYGDQVARRWQIFMRYACARCPAGEHTAAATAAVAMFVNLEHHLDACQRWLGPMQ